MSWFLAAYFAGGLLTLLLPQHEIFPVYSWFLFAVVRQTDNQYGLLLYEAAGRKLEPPRLYTDAEGIVTDPHSVTVFQLTQKFGAIVERNQSQQNEFRPLLERNWLPPATRYELVKLSADPIALWKTGHYQVTQHIKMFATGEAAP